FPCFSPFRKFVVDGLQALAQIKNGIVLARQQSVHAHASLRRQLFEDVAQHLVSDEYFTLFLRQLVERCVQFFEQQNSRVSSVWPGIGRRKQVFQLQHLSVLRGRRLASQRLSPFTAKKVRDPIASHAEQPGRHLLHRLH